MISYENTILRILLEVSNKISYFSRYLVSIYLSFDMFSYISFFS